jgi:hypothetical protein
VPPCSSCQIPPARSDRLRTLIRAVTCLPVRLLRLAKWDGALANVALDKKEAVMRGNTAATSANDGAT